MMGRLLLLLSRKQLPSIIHCTFPIDPAILDWIHNASSESTPKRVRNTSNSLSPQYVHPLLPRIWINTRNKCPPHLPGRHLHTMRQILPVPNPTTSYWLSEPHKFRDLRSTPELPSTCDIAIIGSGLAGVTTAYHILQESDPKDLPSIVLLEARELCSGATARNGGHSKIKMDSLVKTVDNLGSQGGDELQAYVLGVIDGIKTIVEEEELDCEFELRRSFDVQLDAEEGTALQKACDTSRKAGATWTKTASWVPAKHVEQVTSIKDSVSASTVPCASFWPYKFVTQLLERLVARFPSNLNVQTNTPVLSLTTSSSGQNILSTDRGTLHADKLVLATNAYTAGLLPSFKDAIVPVRGMASHINPRNAVHPHLSHTYNIYFGPLAGTDYLNPRPDGSIVVGGGAWHFASDRASWYNNFDDATRFPVEVERHWEGYMQRTFRGWEDSGAQVESVWTGIMGRTPDAWPHVGRVPTENAMWMLAGFNGGGMALILTAARAAARMVGRDQGFEEVREEFGLPDVFATDGERLSKGG